MPLPTKVSDAVRRLNPKVFGGPGLTGNEPISPEHDALMRKVLPPAGPRLRQDRKGPNRLEREFEALLRDEWKNIPGAEVHAQAVTLVLANGVRYTADFMVFQPVACVRGAVNYVSGYVLFYETKGHMRDDAAVKIKVAARTYRNFVFHLVTKRRKKDGGGWSIEEVLP